MKKIYTTLFIAFGILCLTGCLAHKKKKCADCPKFSNADLLTNTAHS